MSDPMIEALKRIAEGGFGDGAGADALSALYQREEQADNARLAAEAKIYADTFETDAGKRCLELLIRKTLLRTDNAEEQAATTAERVALLAERRAGQADIVHDIMAALRIARGLDAKGDDNAA